MEIGYVCVYVKCTFYCHLHSVYDWILKVLGNMMAQKVAEKGKMILLSHFSSEFLFQTSLSWMFSTSHKVHIALYTRYLTTAFNILLSTASIWCSCIWYHGSLEYCLWKPLRRQRENIYTRKEKTQTKSAFVFSQHPEWKDLGGFTLFEKRSLRALLLGAR